MLCFEKIIAPSQVREISALFLWSDFKVKKKNLFPYSLQDDCTSTRQFWNKMSPFLDFRLHMQSFYHPFCMVAHEHEDPFVFMDTVQCCILF